MIKVECSEGYRGPMAFATRAKAQAWIDKAAERARNNPSMCQGTHTIKEDSDGDRQAQGPA